MFQIKFLKPLEIVDAPGTGGVEYKLIKTPRGSLLPDIWFDNYNLSSGLVTTKEGWKAMLTFVAPTGSVIITFTSPKMTDKFYLINQEINYIREV